MKKHFFIILALVLCVLEKSYSQTDYLKWGKLSDKELSISSTNLDTTANAIILAEISQINLDYGHIRINTHVRIKILNQNAFDLADVQLPFYIKNDLEKITSVKAQTINILPNGKVEKIALNKGQFYTTDINENWKAKKFTFPAIQDGSIIEYKYSKLSQNYYYLDDWYFQKEQPVLYSELEVNIPDGLEYNSYLFGHRLKKKYLNKATNSYILEDLPPIKDQKFVYNVDEYSEKINFQLVSYYKSDNLSGSRTKVEVLKNWNELSEEVTDSYNFNSYKKADKHYEEILRALEINEHPSYNDLQKVYDYVVNAFRWNEKNGVFNSKNFKDFIETKTGNSADLNLYLINLLKTAGFNSNPMLISTRSHGKIFKTHPLLSQFNRMVAYIEMPNGGFLINAINPQRPYNLPALSDYVTDGFLLDQKTPSWKKLKINHKSKTLHLVNAQIDSAGFITYHINSSLTGYDALYQRMGINEDGNDFSYKQIKNKNISKTDSLKVTNLDNTLKPLNLDFTIRDNESSIINNEILYFDTFIFDYYQTNPFTDEKREFPIQLPYESRFNLIMNLFIPKGFELAGLPKSEKFNLPKNTGSFTYQNKYFDDKIQINVKVDFSQRELPSTYNEYLKEFYDIIIEKLNERIVLKRISS